MQTRKLIESTFISLDGVISTPQVWGGAKSGSSSVTRRAPSSS